ncbi:cytochrome P450 2C28 [Trichonephila inaurata madagascariensis]|uniref:Cytochrome P450 2C28 n=1 Tax=Trichonephila inaurata madagascariensis TaxID=2747483 RepID=A0A8X7BYL4_9ARAC|nr:cytochrome P450 2C28 [Trichonephila inaurata madagascariensis]
MDATTYIIISFFVVLVTLWLTSGKKAKKRLPGPIGLPIVGYIPFMTRKPYVKLTELSKVYGPVYSVRLGSVNVVIITDYELMKEAFAKDAFMGRPPNFPIELSEDTIKTGALSGLPWKEQKRFSVHMLRDLGFGKDENGRTHQGRNSRIVRTHNLDRLLKEVGRLAGSLTWLAFFPSIKRIVDYFNIGNKGRLVRVLREVTDYCRNEIKKHEETLDPNIIRDFVDGYLLEIQKRANDPDSTFKKDVLTDLSRAFFGAGSETVRVTVDWLLLVCAAHPEVQKKILAEIDDVIGRDRFPTWQDRPNMPFTEAAITELMRWRTIVPLNLIRYTLQDSELNGYYIPKNSHVLPVLWAVDNNEKHWGVDVKEYKPERFLSEDGRKVIKPEYAIPFSVGKRSCPGKTLAEIEIFQYLVAILQKFEISTPQGKEIDFEGELGLAFQPKRQDLCLKLRQ